MIDQTTIEERLWLALRDVDDPELPINIVDMGLVVAMRYATGTVFLKITFTAMGCPAMDMILDDVRARLMLEPDVQHVNVEVVWEPIWTKARLSDDGKAQLREWGISV
jgi:metal-sulfur cluster biosynthetic enzyme